MYSDDKLRRRLLAAGNLMRRPAQVESGQLVRWAYFLQEDRPMPSQGWKVHISVALNETLHFVESVVHQLLGWDVTFKMAADMASVAALNGGRAGSTQVGKIVTLYPHDVHELQKLTRQVLAAWPTSTGPAIQADLSLSLTGHVGVRYGLFREGNSIIDETGVRLPCLLSPTGNRVADHRSGHYAAPSWAPPHGLKTYPHDTKLNLGRHFVCAGQTYRPLHILENNARGSVRLALCLSAPFATVIVKMAYRGVGDGSTMGDWDAVSRLRHEWQILRRLSASEFPCPHPIAFEFGDIATLICSEIEGDNFEALPEHLRLPLLTEAAEVVARLHGLGLAHGDLKPANFMIGPRGVELIDFELAQDVNCVLPELYGGTAGFMPPRDVTGFARDIYALGSCLFFALLHRDPSTVPEGRRGLLLRLHQLSPYAELAEQAWRGEVDAAQFKAILTGLPPQKARLPLCRPKAKKVEELLCQSLRAARRLRTPHGAWEARHDLSDGSGECLNLGAAGTVLGLASMHQILGDGPLQGAGIAAACDALSQAVPPERAAGLFTGNAGVALVLALLGHRYTCVTWQKAAKERLETSIRNVHTSGCDLFSGAAGVLWASCLLSEASGQTWALDAATPLAHRLMQAVESRADLPCWSPPSREGRTPQPSLGASHGSAGIAMALACWGRLMGNAKARSMATDTMAAIFLRGRTSDGSALRQGPGTTVPAPNGIWCHGASGYLWCLLQEFVDEVQLSKALDWAVQASFSEPVSNNAVLCHGMAGQLELAQMLQAVPRHAALARAQANAAAQALAFDAIPFAEEQAWASEMPSTISPSLWVGFVGTASIFALWHARMPHALLSRKWLKILTLPVGQNGLKK